MAQYFCYFGVAMVFVGAIIMLLIKINQNKNLEQMEESK